MRQIRVSVIDDNSVVRENIGKYISMQEDLNLGGLHTSVQDFLNVPMTVYPDYIYVLLLDIGLPKVSGLEGLPLILEKFPQLNVVILSSYEEEDIILKAIYAGACSYVSKTASLHDIAAAVRIVAEGGSYMSPSIAREIVNYLMGVKVSKASILTERQHEILQKLVDGKSYQTIATEMYLSIETVRSHIKKMYRVLHVENKSQAISQYLRGHIK